MNKHVRTSAVKVTGYGIRVDRDMEIHDLEVRTAAHAAIGRGQALDDWLTHLVRVGLAACDAAGRRTDLDMEADPERLGQQVDRVVDDAT